MLNMLKLKHTLNWGINPLLLKNTNPLFFAKPSLKSANCPSLPTFQGISAIYWFFANLSPPDTHTAPHTLKIGFFLKKGEILKKDYLKAFKKLTLFFLSSPVPFNGYQKQKGSGTGAQSLSRSRNKFRKIPLFAIYYYILSGKV